MKVTSFHLEVKQKSIARYWQWWWPAERSFNKLTTAYKQRSKHCSTLWYCLWALWKM